VEEINKVNIVQKPYRLSLLESNIPVHLKTIALNKLASLRHMDPGNGEYYKVKNWVDTFICFAYDDICMFLLEKNGDWSSVIISLRER
jgi:hypothetical protein